MSITSAKAMRHFLGLGVHSPLLFRFVRDVVRTPGGCRYYAQAHVEQLLSGLPAPRRRGLLRLMRMLARGSYRRVYLTSDKTIEKELTQIVLGKDCTKPIPRGEFVPGSLLVASYEPELCLRAMRQGCDIAADGVTAEEYIHALAQHMEGGWIISGGTIAVFLHGDTPQVRFLDLWLP